MTQEEFEKEMLGENGFVRIRKEEGQDQHPTMLERYLEKRARQECEEKHGLEKKLKEVTAERDDLRKKLQEEYDYQEYLKRHRTNGQLGGAIVMDAESWTEHKVRENVEKEKMELRKLANNPALSDHARDVIDAAIYQIEIMEFWRGQAQAWRKQAERK